MQMDSVPVLKVRSQNQGVGWVLLQGSERICSLRLSELPVVAGGPWHFLAPLSAALICLHCHMAFSLCLCPDALHLIRTPITGSGVHSNLGWHLNWIPFAKSPFLSKVSFTASRG